MYTATDLISVHCAGYQLCR